MRNRYVDHRQRDRPAPARVVDGGALVPNWRDTRSVDASHRHRQLGSLRWGDEQVRSFPWVASRPFVRAPRPKARGVVARTQRPRVPLRVRAVEGAREPLAFRCPLVPICICGQTGGCCRSPDRHTSSVPLERAPARCVGRDRAGVSARCPRGMCATAPPAPARAIEPGRRSAPAVDLRGASRVRGRWRPAGRGRRGAR